MKFEKLNVDTNKRGIWILYGLILGVVLIIIINYFISMAKYKVVDTTKLVSSNINYKLPDLTVLGIYVKEGEEYKYVEQLPEGKYTINKELSSCTKKGGEEIKDIIEYREDGLYIEINERGTRCKVYLDGKATAKDTLAKFPNLSVSEDAQKCPQPNGDGFATISDISTEGGTLLCKGVDDDGETYYLRGKAEKNWVKIDRTYWRIIRINGDGSIRLIYNGTTVVSTGTNTLALTSIAFSNSDYDNAYVGYMYGKPSQSSTGNEEAYNKTHANENNSNILNQIYNWYNGNTIPIKLKDYIDINAGFCGDRTPYIDLSEGNIDKVKVGYGNQRTYYGAYVRAVNKIKQATFKCPQLEQDLYTAVGSERGNQKLPVPVGLVSADEAMFAGAVYGSSNASYYLYNEKDYWTISPYSFNSDGYKTAGIFCVAALGNLGYGSASSSNPGVRPVINLKADTPFKAGGDGSSGNPFVVEL